MSEEKTMRDLTIEETSLNTTMTGTGVKLEKAIMADGNERWTLRLAGAPDELKAKLAAARDCIANQAETILGQNKRILELAASSTCPEGCAYAIRDRKLDARITELSDENEALKQKLQNQRYPASVDDLCVRLQRANERIVDCTMKISGLEQIIETQAEEIKALKKPFDQECDGKACIGDGCALVTRCSHRQRWAEKDAKHLREENRQLRAVLRNIRECADV